MVSYYDEVEVRALHSKRVEKKKLTIKQIEDMEFDEENLLFHSPCPCGDRFEISLVCSNLVLYALSETNCAEQSQLQESEDIARCPSCSLIIRVIYDPVSTTCKNDLILKDDFKEDEGEDGKLNALPVEIVV
jgi:diphthamide biosynthesis protein 3